MTDPTSRALTLLGLLERQALWSGRDLADRLGVTTRTVRRDVARLRALGYCVDTAPGEGGGYRLGRGQVLPPLLLDDDEATAATVALTGVVLGGQGVQAEAALRALAKLDAVTPPPLRRRLDVLRQAVSLPERADGLDADLLLRCADAVHRSLRLTFTYVDRHGARTLRTVEPHRLLARGRSWRLLAFDLGRDDWRVFRLDRMSAASVGTWRFGPRSDLEQALARVDEPVPAHAWRHEVRIRIAAPPSEVAASLPRLAGRLVAVDEETTEFVSGADDPTEAAMWLARLDYDFTVTSGEEIRAAVRALGARLVRAAGGR